MNEPLQPIPNTSTRSLDIQKIAADAPTPPNAIPLRDVVAFLRLDACLVCYRGGHTRTPLFTVYKDGTGRERAKACPDHVGQFVRPKQLGLK